MIIAGIYSFNYGEEIITSRYSAELEEVKQVIAAVDSAKCKTKTSREKTMPGRTLYSPRALNRVFTEEFGLRGWEKCKVQMVSLSRCTSLVIVGIMFPTFTSSTKNKKQ